LKRSHYDEKVIKKQSRFHLVWAAAARIDRKKAKEAEKIRVK